MKKSVIALAVAAALIPAAVLADSNNIYGGSPSTNSAVITTNSAAAAAPATLPAPMPVASNNGDLGSINTAINNAGLLNSVLYPTAHARLGDGFWVGVQGGPVMGSVDNGSQGTSAMPGGLFGIRAGYGYTFINGMYLGAQLESDFQNPSFDAGNGFQYSLGNIYSFSILPGYHFSPDNLLYLKVGAGTTHYELDASNSINNYNSNETLYQLGIGYDTALTNNLTLGLEYDYIDLPSSISVIQGTKTQNVSEELYLLSLTYQFDAIDTTSNFQAPLQLAGPYFGIQGGPESGSVDTNGINYGGDGFAGSIHAGYGYVTNQWLYLGADAWIGAHSISAEANNVQMISEPYSYGINFMPGYAINSSRLIYVKVGPEWAQLQGSNSVLPNHTTYSGMQLGWQTGAGYETALTPRLSLLLEYDYNWFSYTETNTSYKYSNNAFSVGLNYRL